MKPTVLATALLAAGLAAAFALAGPRASNAPVKLTGALDAAQEVPALTGAARAGGAFSATLSGRALAWKLTFSRLTGAAAAAHIHLGKPGVAGAVALPLCGPCRSGASGKATVSAGLRTALLAGTAYVNVHTAKNPAGEIRGQILGGTGKAPSTPSAGTTTSGGNDEGGGYEDPYP